MLALRPLGTPRFQFMFPRLPPFSPPRFNIYRALTGLINTTLFHFEGNFYEKFIILVQFQSRSFALGLLSAITGIDRTNERSYVADLEVSPTTTDLTLNVICLIE